MHIALEKALAPILRDVRTTTGWSPGVGEGNPDDPGEPSVYVWLPDSGTAVTVDPWGDPLDNLGGVAERIQDAVNESYGDLGSPQPWPPCPLHEHRHKLELVVVEASPRYAAWACDREGPAREVSRVGELPGPEPRSGRRA